ncbi:G-protein coupled receptor GRL101 [Aplysia californica]|uniref:G-protein coupled receptor GRL101 n=1 Tax=Aplysia californica TaxID=6500 RepID=A0ABM0ZXM2_APLCA|nr:G-protein coupled receptor GRL101 [Aplysia californica]
MTEVPVHTSTGHFDSPLVEDCYSSQLDLLLIVNGDKKFRKFYGKQIEFFSKFLEVFSSGRADDFWRVNVSLALSCVSRYEKNFQILLEFGQYSELTALRRAFMNSTLRQSTCLLPKPKNVYRAAMNYLDSVSAPGRRSLIVLLTFRGMNRFTAKSLLSELEPVQNRTIVTIFVRQNIPASRASMVYAASHHLRSVVILSSFRFLMADQDLSLAVCRRCHRGWIFNSLSSHSGSIAASSCYKILPRADSHWVDANQQCLNIKSTLVKIETVEELTFLENSLSHHMNLVKTANSSAPDEQNFFIGLARNKRSLRREHEWLNRLPLVHSLWATDQPYHRHTGGCAYWRRPAGGGSGYWESEGCGKVISGAPICEAQVNVAVPKVVGVTCPVSEIQKKRALQRGEVAFNVENGGSLKPYTLYPASSRQVYAELPRNNLSFSVYQRQTQITPVSHKDLRLFTCSGSKRLIPYTSVCDNRRDCRKRDDEKFCKNDEDDGDYFRCANGARVLSDFACDLFPDCSDGSDEMGMCSACANWMCPNGECLPKHWFLDGRNDCTGCEGEHEAGRVVEREIAARHGVTDCVFTCNRTDCVTRAMLGDGVLQCTGPEGPLDETVGALESSSCYGENDGVGLSNWGPRCVFLEDPYGGVLGCPNLRHLQGCEDFVCPEGYVKCPRSYCVPVQYVSDGRGQCPLGEDEVLMKLDCTGLFQCPASAMCLHPASVCDNRRDCPSGEDEQNCDVTCRTGFLCVSGTVVKTDYDSSLPLTDLGFVDGRTRYLDVSGVDVSRAFYNFTCRKWRTLVHLEARGSSLRLDTSGWCPGADLTSVIYLDLSDNFLQDSHLTSLFSALDSVRYLHLSHNRCLRRVEIPWLKKLAVLDLSFTGITFFKLHPRFRNLNTLNLKGTQITRLTAHQFPESLKISQLDLRLNSIKHLEKDSLSGLIINKLWADSYKLCCPQLRVVVTECLAPSDPFSSCANLMEGFTSRTLLWVSGVLAVAGNLLVVAHRLVLDRSSLRLAYGQFVAHLSLADFLMGVYLLTIASADLYFRDAYLMHEAGWRESALCHLAGCVSTLSSETSIFFVLLITLDRYLVIRFPFGQYRISGRYVHVLCALAWLLGLSIALLPFVPSFRHWQTYTFTGVCLGLPLSDRSVPGFCFSVSVFVFVNLGLFLLVAAGQLSIYRAMADTRRQMARRMGGWPGAGGREQDLEVTKRLFLVAATDFLCWFPVAVLGLLSLSGYRLGYDAYVWSATLLLPINSAINPILYNAHNILNTSKRLLKHLWLAATEVKATAATGDKVRAAPEVKFKDATEAKVIAAIK